MIIEQTWSSLYPKEPGYYWFHHEVPQTKRRPKLIEIRTIKSLNGVSYEHRYIEGEPGKWMELKAGFYYPAYIPEWSPPAS